MKNNRSINKTQDGGLTLALDGGNPRRVVLRPCFPWTHPTEFLTVRDMDGNELTQINTLDDLDATSRKAVREALTEARFSFLITRIEAIEKDFELRLWRVETAQGKRTFQTKLEDWPQTLAGGGVVIRDLAGDLYHVPDPDLLDKRSGRLLWAFRG